MEKKTIRKKILTKLLDKYYNSKSYKDGSERAKPALSLNEINTIVHGKEEWEQYGGDSLSTNDPSFKVEVNEILEGLQTEGYVTLSKHKEYTDLYDRIYIEKDKVEEICACIGYASKSEESKETEEILLKYKDECVLGKFVEEQLEALKKHKAAKYLMVKGHPDFKRFENILKGVQALLNQKKEIYLRNLSMDIYGDSKVMENILKPICDLIIAYADADDFKASENSTDILAFFNVLRNPSYIYFKGTGTITFISGDTYKLFGNSIGIASNELSMIKKIEIENSGFITVENLTTFHTMESNAFLMYLGGYHNSSRAEFLKKVYKDNPDIEYHHFGDIDAGGFYIFRRLKEATGIPFTPYNMDQTFLDENNKYWKSLTKNDIARLSSIAGREDMSEFKEISEYMLTNNCKLEQEAMH